jgi:hypothetical protein
MIERAICPFLTRQQPIRAYHQCCGDSLEFTGWNISSNFPLMDGLLAFANSSCQVSIGHAQFLRAIKGAIDHPSHIGVSFFHQQKVYGRPWQAGINEILIYANTMFTPSFMTNPIEKAVRIFGSQAALARALGVSAMTVTQWKRRGVPAVRCRSLEEALDGQMTCQDFRPDIFGAPSGERAVPLEAELEAMD